MSERNPPPLAAKTAMPPHRSSHGTLEASPQTMQEAAASYRRGDLRRAEQLCLLLVDLCANHFDALNLLGIIAAQTRHLEQAEHFLRRAVAVRPDDAAACTNYGNVLEGLNRLHEALDCFERALKVKPDHTYAWFVVVTR
jgi:tetratricopeptide (TPR) repeat protein